MQENKASVQKYIQLKERKNVYCFGAEAVIRANNMNSEHFHKYVDLKSLNKLKCRVHLK